MKKISTIAREILVNNKHNRYNLEKSQRSPNRIYYNKAPHYILCLPIHVGH